MRFTDFATIAAFSGVTTSFLIPPPISKTDIDIVNALPFEIAAEGASSIVDLKCNGCPIAISSVIDGKTYWLKRVESSLQLNYTIEQNANTPDQLLINGIVVYPGGLAGTEPFRATQNFDQCGPFDTISDVQLGYELSILPIKKDADSLELISVYLHIFEVADKFVDGIDAVELQLLKTPSGKLMIGSYTLEQSPTSLSMGIADEDKDCTSMLCKWRAIIADKLNHLKPKLGCGKGKGNKNGHHKGQGRPHVNGGRPYSYSDRRHHRHRGLVRFFHMLRTVAIHVLIPVFIGIGAGLAASVIGMFMGHLVVVVWRAIRGGRPSYILVGQEEAADEEDKAIDPRGPPPVYEDIVVESENPKIECEQ